MKLFIQNFSSYVRDDEEIELKKILKQRYGLDTRRQDNFIHLALYGGMLLKEKIKIDEDDELYVTSGVGNIDIVQKTNTYMYEENQPLKLFDFINLLGNTTSYYIAKALGIKGKNIFQISDNFTYINTLVSVYASLMNSGKNAIICSIDLSSKPDEITKRVLEVSENQETTSSVNYQKLSICDKNAIAMVEFDAKCYSLDEVLADVKVSDENIAVSIRCKKINAKKPKKFFETIPSFEINKAIKNQKDMIYIDCFNDKYKILKLKILK